MGAYYGAEIAVETIQAHIQANIATALANVRAERNDPIVSTEVPKEYFIYPTANVYRPPAVFTVFESQKILDIDTGSNFINAVDHVIVAVVVEDRLERLLTVKAWRYQAALMQCLHLVDLTNADNGVKLFSRVESCEFSGIVNLKGENGQQMFRKEMAVKLLIDHIENLE